MNKTLYEKTTESLQVLPEPLLWDVYDFVTFLVARYEQTGEIHARSREDLAAKTMTQIAATGGAFDWLLDPKEDNLYTDADGEPV